MEGKSRIALVAALEDFMEKYPVVHLMNSGESAALPPQCISREVGDEKTEVGIIVDPVLEEFIQLIAKTGQTLLPWSKVRPLFLYKLDEIMRKFNEKDPFDNVPAIPNNKPESFRSLHQSILTIAAGFKQAPFTIQRLCELIVNPYHHYKRVDKFLRGLEKNVLIVTTVDEKGCKLSRESDMRSDISNGFESHAPFKPTMKNSNMSSMLGWFNATVSGPPEAEKVSESENGCVNGQRDLTDSVLAARSPHSALEPSVATVNSVLTVISANHSVTAAPHHGMGADSSKRTCDDSSDAEAERSVKRLRFESTGSRAHEGDGDISDCEDKSLSEPSESSQGVTCSSKAATCSVTPTCSNTDMCSDTTVSSENATSSDSLEMIMGSESSEALLEVSKGPDIDGAERQDIPDTSQFTTASE